MSVNVFHINRDSETGLINIAAGKIISELTVNVGKKNYRSSKAVYLEVIIIIYLALS